MNKLFTKITSLALGAAMMIGVGVSVGSKNVSAAHAATKTGEWDLTSTDSDFYGNYETYFSQPYGFKKANEYIANKSVSDFGTSGTSQIKVGIKCLQNNNTGNRITVWLINSSGTTLGDGIVVTPPNATAASKTGWVYATFTASSQLTNAYGFMAKLTTKSVNSLVNGANYEVTYTESTKTLSSISVTTAPTKTSYYVHQSFDPTGMVVTASYDDSSTANVTSSCTFTPSPFTTAGNQNVTVSYTEGGTTKTTTQAVTVSNDTLSSISIAGQTTTLAKGAPFSFGGTVTAHYASGSTADVTSSAIFTGYDMSTASNQEVTVSYTEGGITKTATYTLSVANLNIVEFVPGTDTGDTSVTKSGVTATMSTMNNSNYYQIYASASGTFECAENILKIEFTCTTEGTAKYGPGNTSANVGSYSYDSYTGTWTGSATSVTLSSTAQVRMTSLVITTEVSVVETYTVSFNGNTASRSMDDVTDVVGDYTLPANGFTVPSGKVFTGWKANNTGNLLTAGSTYDVQADVEFYAQWSDVYTVSFNGNTASGSMADVTDVAGNYTLPANGYTVPSGKEFLGWKANNSGDTLAAGSNYVVSANVTFYAQWGNVWNVTFTAGTNGTGSKIVSVSEGSYTLPEFSTLSPVSADTGYQFKNYTIGGTNYNSGAEVTINAATPVTVNFEEKPLSATYDFTTNWDTYASSWGGYAAHTITGTQLDAEYEALISFTQASKQSGTITDRPVINAKQGLTSTMLFELDSSVSANYVITSVSVSMLQWTTKVVSYSLYKGTSVSGDALDSGSAGTKNTISTSNLNGDSFIVNFTSTSSSNIQLGVSSITINLKAKSSFGTLDHISVTALPNTIYHVGEYFDPTGLKVTAYDGADESTANFKDVTSEIVTLLDDTYQFADGDVPGFDADINYEESDVTKSTSLHVHVYALAEYELVTSEPANWAGNYLLVASYTDAQSNSHTVAINSALTNFDQPLNFKEVTVVNDTITTGQECEFTVASYSTGYSMQGKNGKYAYGNSNNRFMTSDTAQALTLSLSSNIVTVTGASGYNLRMNATTHGEERFGFYNTGSVDIKFYKLKESSAASTYADYFLETLSTGEGAVCDAGGESDIDDLKVAWALVAYEFTQLSGGDRGQFTEGVADEKGTNIQQAVALYDYIAWKYGHSLESEDCEEFDFMSRNITPKQNLNVKALLGGDTVNSTAIIIVTSMIGLSAVGGFFFLRKRKEI